MCYDGLTFHQLSELDLVCLFRIAFESEISPSTLATALAQRYAQMSCLYIILSLLNRNFFSHTTQLVFDQGSTQKLRLTPVFTSYLLSTPSSQPQVLNRNPSTTSPQPQSLNHNPSTTSPQPQVLDHRSQPQVLNHTPSTTRPQPHALNHPPSTTRPQPKSTNHTLSTHTFSTSIRQPQ
jgi:hypothetical protein